MEDLIQKEIERLNVDNSVDELKKNLSLTLKKFPDLKPIIERIENVINILYKSIRDCDRTYTSPSLISKAQGYIHQLAELFNPDSNRQEEDLRNDSNHHVNNLLEIIPLFRRRWDEEDLEKFIGKISENLQSNYDNVNLIFKKRQIEATEIVDDLKAKQTESEKLIQFLSEATISDFYARKANEHAESAKKWTYATWGFAGATILVLVVALIYQIWKSINVDSINYALLSSKILLTATLGLIAKWTSKQASRHNIEETKYRRLSLNMATLKPFIDTLEEGKKNEVMAAIAIKTFTDSGVNEFATDFEAPNLGDLIKNYLNSGTK